MSAGFASILRTEAMMVRLVRAVLGLGLIMLVIINVANALGRFTGWFTLVGADEILIYGMIWIVMLGAILAARDHSHLSINLLQQSLTPRASALLQIVIDVVTFLASAFIAHYSFTFIERIAKFGQKSMALGIPMVIPHGAIFVGFVGIAAITFVLFVSDLFRLSSGRFHK